MKINFKEAMGFASTIMALMLILPSNTIGQKICHTSNIVNNQVANCDCAQTFTEVGCKHCIDPTCPNSNHKAPLHSCKGCTNADINCGQACELYFSQLCHCLKKTAHNCQNSGRWWLENSHYIITTQDQVTGILELGSDNGGWAFGQSLLAQGVSQNGKVVGRDTGALSVNSVTVRDQDQIHIHVCDNQNSKLRDYLSTKVQRTDYSTLKRIAWTNSHFPLNTIRCQASQKKGASNMDVAGITTTYVNKQKNPCDRDFVGAGLITDKHDYSWVCVTKNERYSAEELLCGT